MNSQMFKRMLAWVAALLLILAGSFGALAEDTDARIAADQMESMLDAVYSGRRQIRDMTVNYGAYGGEAEAANAALLEELAAINPDAAARWERILALWKDVDAQPVYPDVLPDGLPDTDALCLVALGFQLNPDGTMREELIRRLEVLLRSAEKYPNAYIVCTGGGTAAWNESATEAGRMAEWLIAHGVNADRVIVEDASLTTAQNAMYTYDILTENYPRVKQLAIISSDYHIATGTLLFEAEAILRAETAGQEAVTVVSNAAYAAPSGTLSRMFQAGALIELAGDEQTAFEIYYDTYDIHELPKPGKPAASALERILSRGVMRVGTAGDYQPMSYLDPESGAYVGFDAALAEDLAAALGVEIEYVKTSWPTLMEDTLAGKFDLAICGITVTEARKEQALMSDGYLANGKTVLCRAEDAGKYTSLAAINRPEVRVMESPGGLNEKFARENLPDATLIIHGANQEIPGLVAAGEADVMITEIMEAGYYVGQDSRLAAPLIYAPFTQGQLGVLLPPESGDLLDYVNAFLTREKESGRIDELAEEYIYRYIREEALPAA
ncbi:MAG: transporter substrate-binding domain-containing protein [Clostridiales bacterium]|nr:transporter substrate-binding domain-containing protein [Clostridiales bacterium]